MKNLSILCLAFILAIGLNSCNSSDTAVSSSEKITDYIESVSITKKALKLEKGSISEYDFHVFIIVDKEKKDHIESIDLVFPDGREVKITKEEKTMEGQEHLCGFGFEPAEGLYHWYYRNIAMTDMSLYGDGFYSFNFKHKDGSESFKIKFQNPETGEQIPLPEWPVLKSPQEDSELNSAFEVSLEDHTNDVAVFFGLPSPDPNVDFSEWEEFVLAGGSKDTKTVKLNPGDWRGDISAVESVDGVINGLKWQLDVLATYEFALKIK